MIKLIIKVKWGITNISKFIVLFKLNFIVMGNRHS